MAESGEGRAAHGNQWTLPMGLQVNQGEAQGEGGRNKQEGEGPEDTSVTEFHSTTEDSCFRITLERMRYSATKPDVLEKELQWQQAGRQNHQNQDNFKEEILAQRHLRPFAIMCHNSPFLTICHSIAKFFGEPGDEEKGLHGKCMAFVGDRDTNREPQVIILPDEAWEWISPEVYVDYEALEQFYDADTETGNGTRLFIPPPRSPRHRTPHMLRKDHPQEGQKSGTKQSEARMIWTARTRKTGGVQIPRNSQWLISLASSTFRCTSLGRFFTNSIGRQPAS